MKIIGHTPSNELIIIVSQEEWGQLQEGRGLQDDDWHKKWKKTEAYRFLVLHSARGKSAFQWMYKNGDFDGTLETLEKMINDEIIHIDRIGPGTREHIKQALRENNENR
jgi:hypothetical protein